MDIAVGIPVVIGATLLAAVAELVTVVTSRSYRRTSLAGAACAALALLDIAIPAAVVSAAPALTWLIVVATAASVARIIVSVHNLPRILTHC